MKYAIFRFLLVLTMPLAMGQTSVKGTVIDRITLEKLPNVHVTLEGTPQATQTDTSGAFVLFQDIAIGDQILRISKEGYVTRRFPIVIYKDNILDLGEITFDVDVTAEQQLNGLISLSDNDLNREDDDLGGFNISGLLSAGRDTYLSAAAFDWSATFFRPRGLDNANGKLLINGIEMNKQFNGRPQWGNWGGLNDAQRNREFTAGLSANEYAFGGLGGVTNITMRASQYRKGGRVSYAGANRSYEGRVMGSYSSGLLTSGWAFTFLASRRFGNEGYVEGTLYDANSIFASVEKKFNEQHSLNLTAIYTPNRRGRSTALTQEIFDLKGRQYNPFWGYLNGEIRNTRIREIEEPILMLNHTWDISEKTSIETSLGYQTGTIKNSRIDANGTTLVASNGQQFFAGGARNPSPDYYQLLPSFFLQDENPTAIDFQNAFLAQEQLVNDGQFDWNVLYEGNAALRAQGRNALYVLQNDVIEDTQFSATSIVNSAITDHITLHGNVSYRRLHSENYAEIEDLLGGTGYLDIDNFTEAASEDASGLISTDNAQSDVRNPNRIVGEGDRYKYNYQIDANVVAAFAQAQFKYNKVDFYIGTTITQTSYQRNGLFENGNFQNQEGAVGSFGPSEALNFSTGGVKAGLAYKITGRHIIDVNGGYYTNAPTIRNSFVNARQNNEVIEGLVPEQLQSVDVSYIYRSPLVKARLTGYYTVFEKGTNIGFYFTEDLGGLGNDGNAFVQEILTNIGRRHMGVELGIEAQVLPTLKVKAAASVGQYTFTNNPNLYLRSDDFDGALRFGDGTTNLENLHVAGGPERAFQVGFEYRDPDFWNIGVTTNYLSNAYIDVSNLARSANFVTDSDGLPINDFDAAVGKSLLQQQEFDAYFLVNIIGGKSWRVRQYFLGFFATINNVLDQQYVTGGFEQSRNATFRNVRDDQARENGPVFGPRYFFGNGTTYFLNFYVRF
ncbi:carboxypeptidase-like regulatory domain-containing protein [Dokdonia ponticola]|uniref:Carboxypeptidase-like regulatory domain-containing protein n=1 Tax=Dokdonia ponticola TaxID=2041041 RepID=A0ABV9HZ15_9FLAO